MIYFELFYVFFYIGLFTFGGGYAMIGMIQEEVINRAWMGGDSLIDFIAISESTPGPFAINIATFIGSQVGGILGAVCATLGVVLPSFIIILLVAMIMKKILKNRFVQGGLSGVRPVVISLILSTALFFFLKIIFSSGNAFNYHTTDFSFNRSGLAILIILATICLLYKKDKKKSLNPIIILAISAGLGIVVYYLFNL